MKEEHIAYALIALTCFMGIANIAGWIDVSWWIVVAPVLTPFVLVLGVALILCLMLLTGVVFNCIRFIIKGEKFKNILRMKP